MFVTWRNGEFCQDFGIYHFPFLSFIDTVRFDVKHYADKSRLHASWENSSDCTGKQMLLISSWQLKYRLTGQAVRPCLDAETASAVTVMQSSRTSAAATTGVDGETLSVTTKPVDVRKRRATIPLISRRCVSRRHAI